MNKHAPTFSIAAALLLFAVNCHAAAVAPDPYADGVRRVQRAISEGDLDRAEQTVKDLSRRYGGNAELLSMRGRILFWRKRYGEAIAAMEASLRLKADGAVSSELERVKTAERIAEADRLAAAQKRGDAEKILVSLFEAGKVPYESGLRLVRLRMQNGDHAGAGRVLAKMLPLYPEERDLVRLNAQALLGSGKPEEALSFLEKRPETPKDPELLAQLGRARMRVKRYSEAVRSYDASLALADDPDVRLERGRAVSAELLERVDGLVAQGKEGEAASLLAAAFERGEDRYGVGMRLAAIKSRGGNPGEAAKLYLLLKTEYPRDRELPLLCAKALADAGEKERALQVLDEMERKGEDPQAALLRARVLNRQGDLSRARGEYRRALSLGAPASEAAAELNQVEAGLAYRRAVTLVDAGDRAGAEPLLELLSTEDGPYAGEARLLKLKLLIAERRGGEAAALGAELHETLPYDADVSLLYAEALILSGERAKAEGVLEGVGGPAGEELLYRARQNWVKLYGGEYGYSGGRRGEETFGVAASKQFRRFTAVGAVSQTSRFGETDRQLAVDLYSKKRPEDDFYGSLSVSLSPGAKFLPRNSFGGELVRPFGSFEASAGYSRLNFRGSGADVLKAGLLWYVPATALSLGEKVYFAPASGTATWVTTLRWDPRRRASAFASVGVGNSGERPSLQEDFRRYGTFSVRSGAEYRFSPCWSFGGEGEYESRRGLYDRYGVSLFVKYWWP